MMKNRSRIYLNHFAAGMVSMLLPGAVLAHTGDKHVHVDVFGAVLHSLAAHPISYSAAGLILVASLFVLRNRADS